MKLVIVESPKKCQTIARYLGEGFEVVASQGHIRDLSTHGKMGLGIDLENGYVAQWVIPEGKKAIVRQLRSAVNKAEVVYLATDPDREGEAIAWHLAEVLNLDVDSTPRLEFHEITRQPILDAIASPSKINLNRVKAQETRRLEDRIIGFRVSDLLRRNYGRSLPSAGRVQSSTLRMIVDRQAAIDAFVSQEYWTIDVNIEIDGKVYKAALKKVDGKAFECKTKEEADALLARIGETLTVSSVSKTPKSIAPKLPFITSSLQQEAFNKFGFSNARTQSIAQKLYEEGRITYMRTDSPRISQHVYANHMVPFIKETFGDAYVGPLRSPKEKKNVQDAHEAIRPTSTHATPEIVGKELKSPDGAKLYRLIYCRAIASVMAPKQIEATSVTLETNGLEFALSGSRTLFPGFAAIYGAFEEEESGTLPPMEEGQSLRIAEVLPQQKFTKPEPQYNQASIVKAMEENGIGRPSTYAPTIETLIKRRYVSTEKGSLIPTETGKKAVEALSEYFPNVVSTTYTAEMENELDKVEEGALSFKEAMDSFYLPFQKNFEEAKANMVKEGPEPTGELCPQCGSPLVYRKNRKGDRFIGCSSWPKCKYIQHEPKKPDELVGENCPQCGSPLVYKLYRGKKFIGCSNYPKCDYSRDPKAKPGYVKKPKKTITEADYVKPCPDCKNGHLIIRNGKRGPFLGCTNFPKCRHIENLPDEEK